MTITLPTGWNTFSGGGADPDLCGEPQDCANPPCGEIPPMSIRPTGTPRELDCTHLVLSMDLEVDGGIAPFTWETTEGQIEVTGPRTATLHIDSDVDLTGRVFIGVQLKNPCFMPAFFIRGRSAFTNLGACDENFLCTGLSFNCKGENIGEISDAASDTCDGFLETATRLPFDASTDFYDYTNCGVFPDAAAWPLICRDIPAESPQVEDMCVTQAPVECQGTNPLTWKIYNETGLCADTPGTGTNSSASHLVEYMADDPTRGSICDVRTPNLKAKGCSPCFLLKDSDIIVTATDVIGEQAVIDIHVAA